ncbi:MAG: putative GTP-binding protein YjiA [Alphaproteobacteria bacterium MarineAlpha2_Bin1]|nr:MAG: putative GTP-binding protein YjiA [Alphaproteobacteria bacterium MarineAlpha2_Bin1]
MNKTVKKLIPMNVITGFLGSGKTSLLRNLLKLKSMSNTLVLVNEFGEVGLDHEMMERLDKDTVLLQSGCICCTIREDLTSTLSELLDRRFSKEISFSRVILETTGLADPSPIIYSICKGNIIKNNYRLSNVITTVDAINGIIHMNENYESKKQIAVADRIMITKSDINKNNLSEILQNVKELNPSAPIFYNNKKFSFNKVFKEDLFSLDNKSEIVQKWVESEGSKYHKGHIHNTSKHNEQIYTFHLKFDEEINWTTFGIWLTMLLHYHGENILRVKGILNVIGSDYPVAIHGVQHFIHQPMHLKSWPNSNHESRLVFILKKINSSDIVNSLDAFNRLGKVCME